MTNRQNPNDNNQDRGQGQNPNQGQPRQQAHGQRDSQQNTRGKTPDDQTRGQQAPSRRGDTR